MTTPNPNSILDSIKKALGLDPDYDAFDLDVIMYINTSFATLQQLGAGPVAGFVIFDNTSLWSEFTDNTLLLSMVKSYVYAKSRLLFDPPVTSFGLDAMKTVISELEWRINIQAESIPPASSSRTWWDLTGVGDFPAEAATGDWGYDSVTWNIYVKDQQITPPALWNLTGLSDFPDEAVVGELGYDTVTGNVWRKTT